MTQPTQTRKSNRLACRGLVTLFAVAFVASTALAVPGVPSGATKYRGGNNNKNNNNNNNQNNPNNPNTQTPAPAAEPQKIDTTAYDQARKDATAAKTEVQKAQAAVAAARAKLMKSFDTKPEVIEAKKK